MVRIPVSSRIIKAVYFDNEDGSLRLCFANGEERLFADVPVDAVQEMVEAESPGHHYIDRFRHRFRRVA
ncbi:KTSC domain-containing protein [Aureimonas leprariae]|uniref:KTSC domain-containing protein n=2 Tax=Plantimonas leprariae TaxID=2615207 RepID=A0A7V7U0W2_9HYPH|nr:KTSC domain-containing protein [Aureimonas leprariae]